MISRTTIPNHRQYAVSENAIRVASKSDPVKVEVLQRNSETIWAASAAMENLKAILQKALVHYQATEYTYASVPFQRGVGAGDTDLLIRPPLLARLATQPA